MKTLEQIKNDTISSMCTTYRHDYGLDKIEYDGISIGTTIEERKYIWSEMENLYQHHILPLIMELRKRENEN